MAACNPRSSWYCSSDCIFNILGIIFFFTDVVSDICAVVGFYQEKSYVSMGVLVFLLVGSSALVQAFSWLWYTYGSVGEEEKNCLEKYVYLEKYLKNRGFLGAMHVCQMGVLLRLTCMMEISLRNLTSNTPLTGGIADYMTHDLSLLYLIEAFAESAPQLTLMTAVIIHRQEMEFITGFKTVIALGAIAFSVVLYHSSMRSLRVHVHPSEAKQTWTSSLLYFLWNFFLVAPRVMAVALAASALPSGIIALHFLFLWVGLFLWACYQRTDFMESPVGEWLYRATVALVWYFSWFNVTKGDSRGKNIAYHSIMAADNALLLFLWWWWRQRERDPSVRSVSPSVFGPTPLAVFILLAVSYTLGILVKVAYYRVFHTTKVAAVAMMPCIEEEELALDMVDFPVSVQALPPPLSPPPPQRPVIGCQRRTQLLAEHFYS